MKNTLILILMALFLFLAIYFYWGKSQAESNYIIAEEKITSLEEQVRRYTHRPSTDSISPATPTNPQVDVSPDNDKITPPASAAFEDEIGSLTDADIQRLKRKGLKNPEAELMNDLIRKQKSLLTTSGSMGGTMAIRDVRILNDRHALAYFEDGHNAGHMLLRYTVENGNISWTKLDSYTL